MKTTKPTKKQLTLKIESIDTDKLLEFISPRIAALALHLDLTLGEAMNELTESIYDDTLIEYGSEEYKVLTDDEAEQANEESIENYIDECILPELPDRYRSYFDNEAFMRDAKMDGRGHNLATYDGEENEVKLDETWYFIYRTN